MEIFFIGIILMFAFGIPLYQLISDNHKLSDELSKLKIEHNLLESRFKTCIELKEDVRKFDRKEIFYLKEKIKELEMLVKN